MLHRSYLISLALRIYIASENWMTGRLLSSLLGFFRKQRLPKFHTHNHTDFPHLLIHPTQKWMETSDISITLLMFSGSSRNIDKRDAGPQLPGKKAELSLVVLFVDGGYCGYQSWFSASPLRHWTPQATETPIVLCTVFLFQCSLMLRSMGKRQQDRFRRKKEDVHFGMDNGKLSLTDSASLGKKKKLFRSVGW